MIASYYLFNNVMEFAFLFYKYTLIVNFHLHTTQRQPKEAYIVIIDVFLVSFLSFLRYTPRRYRKNERSGKKEKVFAH